MKPELFSWDDKDYLIVTVNGRLDETSTGSIKKLLEADKYRWTYTEIGSQNGSKISDDWYDSEDEATAGAIAHIMES